MDGLEQRENEPPLRCWNDLAYVPGASPNQHAHLFVPEGEGPFPLVLCMHGGGWTQGVHHGYARVAMPLAQKGFAAATVGYTKVDKHPWPAPLEDLMHAVDFFREHADTFCIDPDKICALGDSAGGHLAMMLSTKRRLRAVISLCGPTDLRPPVETSLPGPYEDICRHPALSPEEVGLDASPVLQLKDPDCAVLQLHGELDTVVPNSQGISLKTALDQRDVRNDLRFFAHSGHDLIFHQEEKVRDEVIAFLKEYVQPPLVSANNLHTFQ